MVRGMNPDLDYEAIDLLSSDFPREFDVATAIKILERIRPDDLPAFVSSITDILADDERFVLTVPDNISPAQGKQYQHFSADVFESLLEPQFETVEFVPFDKQSKVFAALELALGGRGRHFVVNSPPLVDTLWKLYQRRYLYADSESNCGRIAAVCRR